MKIIAFLIIGMLFYDVAICQDTVPTSPNVLLTRKQMKEKMMLSRIGNYDKEVGRELGEFSAVDINGKTISQKDLIGKVSFVGFWFDACSPCHSVFAPLNDLYTRYKLDSNFQVLSFTFDGIETLKKNVAKYNLLYRNIPVSNAICHDLMGTYRGFSCTYLVDQQGKIIFGHSGVSEKGANVFTDIITPKIDSLLKIQTVQTNPR